MKSEAKSVSVSKFNLKHMSVDLIRRPAIPARAEVSTEALEAVRTARQSVPASKHGLEVICGASCETGAT